MTLFKKVAYGANNDHDTVVISFSTLCPRVAYQTAFEMSHKLRLQCKRAARLDRASATLAREFMPDLKDCPRPHRGFRRSRLVPNVQCWKTGINGKLVWLGFNGECCELGYEDGLKWSSLIREAARRAKAWAGDTSKQMGMHAMLTDGEEDYKLGLM